LTSAYISFRLRLARYPTKNPDLLGEVGFGRRVRGDAKKLNMMGGILPEK